MDNSGIQIYVAGLLFSEDRKQVAVVHKLKPEWQKNRLNAIGGKVEDNETPSEAMVREFKEETGVHFTEWEYFCNLSGKSWQVLFYVGFGNVFAVEPQVNEVEHVSVFGVDDLLNESSLMPNLKVLIPLALDTSGISKPVYMHDYS